MPFSSADLIAAALAYALGSLSFAVIVSKALALPDPKSYGSGNPGATNVLRSGSKKAAVLTLLGDTLKGVIAVLVAKHFGGLSALPIKALRSLQSLCFSDTYSHCFLGSKAERA